MEILEKLKDSLIAVGEQSRDCIEVEGFKLFIDANSDDVFLSFATPTTSTDWPSAIKAMQAAFKTHKRRARLEYFHDLHPDLRVALENAGFVLGMGAPVMALAKPDLCDMKFTNQGRYRRLGVQDKAVIESALRRQSLAYGGTGDDSALAWMDALLAGLKLDTKLFAVLEKEKQLVSGAVIQIGGGIGELAGVWTHPNEQKRGYAFELCHQLLKDYFSLGYELCWLSAAEDAQRLYEKLGFKTIGTQLNYELPA